MSKTFIKVALGSRSYEACVGAGIVENAAQILKKKGLEGSKRAFIIADARLKDARRRLLKGLRGWDVHEIPVKAGEGFKDFAAVYKVYGELLKHKADRKSVLFALGGGSIGDAAGFIASTYMRGIPWVGVPTTLLAQVDSSLGGKTAVNHSAGKNLIGTFHQPSLVLCDTQFLRTLSKREVVSGLGEILKYGLIYDRKFFSYVIQNWSRAVALDDKVLVPMVESSLRWKAKAVSRDEFDRLGVREALNFGHTFGHAVEAETRYKKFQHGEAVLWGMRFAVALSNIRGHIKDRDYAEASAFLASIDLPALPSRKPSTYFRHMLNDKKAEAGKVRFVVLKAIGAAGSDRSVSAKDLQRAYALMLEAVHAG